MAVPSRIPAVLPVPSVFPESRDKKAFFRYQTGLYAASFCIAPGISALGTTQPAPYPKRAAVKITGSGKTDFFSVKQDNRSVHAETASSPQIRTLTVCKDNRSVTVLPGNRSIPERISAPRHTVPVNRTRNLAASCIPTGIPARPAMIFSCMPSRKRYALKNRPVSRKYSASRLLP